MIDTYTDSRDGNRYKIVKINNLYWFAENLRYQGVPHYFPDRNSDNLHQYGYLYTWENAKKACPPGWRLPTKNEFYQLLKATGAGNNSSSVRNSTWANGSNSSGFSVQPAGYRNPDGYCYYFGAHACFWSATPMGCDFHAYSLFVGSDYAHVYGSGVYYALSIRCVKEI